MGQAFQFRAGRAIWPLVAFLIGFTVLIALVSNQFLIPALVAAKGASVEEKRQLVAFARLLLAIVLLILWVGILFLFRIRRFFFPRSSTAKQKTEYVDAWAEAGRRMQEPRE